MQLPVGMPALRRGLLLSGCQPCATACSLETAGCVCPPFCVTSMNCPLPPLQDPGKVLERTRLPRSAQQQHAARLLCPDPEAAPAAKRGRWSDDVVGHVAAGCGGVVVGGGGMVCVKVYLLAK